MMRSSRLLLAITLTATLTVFCTLTCVSGFYLPGVAPRDYVDGEEVEVKVVKLDSVKTQLPYDYYSLPWGRSCKPPQIEEAAENLGEIMSGDRIETSAYKVEMKKSTGSGCEILCREVYTDADLAEFADKIADEYRVNLLVDGLPAATKYFTTALPSDDTSEEFVSHYEKGYALGFVGHADIPGSTADVKYVNNHVVLLLFYHQDQQAFAGSRIVGFEVEAFSVKHTTEAPWSEKMADNKLTTCSSEQKVSRSQAQSFQAVSSLKPSDDHSIIWTYEVRWEEKRDVKWASRWDLYLKMTDSKIHWFSIINSIMIVLFLSGMVAVIMMRTLHKDLARYNEQNLSEEEQQEETGWKLIHGDVFRPPAHGGLFSVLVGTGVQVFAMTLLTLMFAVLGFLSPANRGGLMTALLLLFVFMGMFAGYYSTRIYKMFKLTEWKKNTLVTALLFPGITFGTFFVLNLFVWGEKSSGAVPFFTLVALLVLWLGISLPLVYLGSYFAFKKPAIEPPVKVNNLCRLLLPEQSWYTSPTLSILVGGVLPFAAVFIEIFFIMSSVWLHQFYYVFGFLFIVFVILIITCAEITIVMCYFQLCNEDYHWWWRSYLTPGSSALYLFLYSILYFFTKLEIVKFISGLLFFGYMFLVSLAFFLLTGTIGFFATFMFVRKIYGSIKVD